MNREWFNRKLFVQHQKENTISYASECQIGRELKRNINAGQNFFLHKTFNEILLTTPCFWQSFGLDSINFSIQYMFRNNQSKVLN